MPNGPEGQKRPGDAAGDAVMVGRIATGEIEDNATPADKAHHGTGWEEGWRGSGSQIDSSGAPLK